jgi:predicted enzyme related to lactoylglutathione lyase
MAIKSIDLGWIVISDIKKSKQFFKDVLGLTLVNETPEYGWMELVGKEGGCSLGVGQSRGEHPVEKLGQNTVLTFTVDDLVKTIKELQAKGVTFIDEIVEVPGHVKMITFVDPDGNKFQLCEQLGDKR